MFRVYKAEGAIGQYYPMDQPATKIPATNPFRGAVLTIFNVERIDQLPDKLDYFAYGVETCPTTSKTHLQSYAYASRAMRLTAWKKIFPTAHIEQMRGTFTQNEKYCSKQSELVEFGVRPMDNGKRKDLDEVCQRIIGGESLVTISGDYPKVYLQYHNGIRSLSSLHSQPYEHETVRGFWLWGVPGAGKSHYARSRFSSIYVKSQNKWFDGYDGQETILLDDYDCGRALGHYLKIWCDKWACSGEVKGGTVHLRHHYFVITSNYSIEEMFPEDIQLQDAVRRRCEVIHFKTVYK